MKHETKRYEEEPRESIKEPLIAEPTSTSLPPPLSIIHFPHLSPQGHGGATAAALSLKRTDGHRPRAATVDPREKKS